MGERLQAGDRLITGSVVQVPIGIGDRVVAEIDAPSRGSGMPLIRVEIPPGELGHPRPHPASEVDLGYEVGV